MAEASPLHRARTLLRVPLLLLIALRVSSCAGVPAERHTAAAAEPSGVVEGLELSDWIRTRGAGLRIYSNAPREELQRQLYQLDQFVALVSHELYGRPVRFDAAVEVILFRSFAQYEHFIAAGPLGHTTTRRGRTYVAFPLELGSLSTYVLYHELVHAVLFADRSLKTPPWMHEGFAEFFGTAIVRSDVVTLGGVPSVRLQRLSSAEVPPLESILSAATAHKSSAAATDRFYTFAWLFVHYGYYSERYGGTDRSAAFREFVAAQRRGLAWRDAFERAFAVPLSEIQAEFEAHRNALVARVLAYETHFVVGIDAAKPDFERVEPAEMASRLLELASLSADDPGLVFDLCSRVLAARPDALAARFGRIQAAAKLGRFERADEDWQALSPPQRTQPEAWMSRAVLGHEHYRALPRRERERDGRAIIEDARGAYAAALEADPDWLEALVRLGDTFILDKDTDPTAGVAALHRSLELSPSLPRARLDLALLLIRSGELVAAREHLDYLVESFPKTEFESGAKRLLRRHY